MNLNDIVNTPEFPAILARFENFFVKLEGKCWNWEGSLSTARPGKGDALRYGRFSVATDTKIENAHRAAYVFYTGPIPDGLWVLHRCDNARCVNPKHLFLGTVGDNNRDTVSKGRHASRTAAIRARRTDAEIIAVREFKGTNKEAGRIFGMSADAARKIRAGQTWPNLPLKYRPATRAQMLATLRAVRDAHRG